MNREEIIKMAREAGDYLVDKRGREDFIFDSYGIERFAALVAAAERGACAKVCYDKSWELKNEAMKSESKTKGVRLNDCAIVLYDAHKAIRARGQE